MTTIFIFIISFLSLNFLVFIPNLVVSFIIKNDQEKVPFFNDTPYFIFKKMLYLRFSNDCFRLIFEVQVIALLVLLIGISYQSFFKAILICLVMISFIYVTYITIIIKIFKKDPILINDYHFVKTGFMVYKKQIGMIILFVLAFFIGLFFIVNGLINVFLESSFQISQKWLIALIILTSILVSLVSIKKIKYSQYHSCVSFSIVKHLYHNLYKSKKLKRSLKTLNEKAPYNYINEIKLKVKPNIILVFVESYGSFAFSNEKYGSEFRKTMNGIYKSLSDKDWKIASAFSDAPVASGGSWLSHSSILFGTKVNDIAAHELIFSQTEYVSKLESLPRFLENFGYKTTLASTLSYHKNELNWEKVSNVYPFKKMMLHDDFEYTGQKVNIYGDRFALPDEYTLNYAYDIHRDNSPFFLCVNTINSHHKYVSPIETFNNWKDYNNIDFSVTDGLSKNYVKNYFSAINYQLKYIEKFLLNNKFDDTITILIGDHQPPFITPANIDKATPIHIISKNQEFINAFNKFNFEVGLNPSQKHLKHESFFSKFLYALNRAYGVDKNLDLSILEDGINLY